MMVYSEYILAVVDRFCGFEMVRGRVSSVGYKYITVSETMQAESQKMVPQCYLDSLSYLKYPCWIFDAQTWIWTHAHFLFRAKLWKILIYQPSKTSEQVLVSGMSTSHVGFPFCVFPLIYRNWAHLTGLNRLSAAWFVLSCYVCFIDLEVPLLLFVRLWNCFMVMVLHLICQQLGWSGKLIMLQVVLCDELTSLGQIKEEGYGLKW